MVVEFGKCSCIVSLDKFIKQGWNDQDVKLASSELNDGKTLLSSKSSEKFNYFANFQIKPLVFEPCSDVTNVLSVIWYNISKVLRLGLFYNHCRPINNQQYKVKK